LALVREKIKQFAFLVAYKMELKTEKPAMVLLPIWAKSLNTLLRLMRLLWQTFIGVESM
jgi:hypothetical protein